MISSMTALSRLIATAMDERGLSNRDVARMSGGVFGHATVYNYRSGREPKRPDDATLRAFSGVLGIPLRTLYHAAGVAEPLGDWTPPPEANRMTLKQRDAVTEIIKLLVAAAETPGPQPVPPPRDTPATTNKHLRARRMGLVEEAAPEHDETRNHTQR